VIDSFVVVSEKTAMYGRDGNGLPAESNPDQFTGLPGEVTSIEATYLPAKSNIFHTPHRVGFFSIVTDRMDKPDSVIGERIIFFAAGAGSTAKKKRTQEMIAVFMVLERKNILIEKILYNEF
jgi:hypothetical protein